jgi:hypothetical protein
MVLTPNQKAERNVWYFDHTELIFYQGWGSIKKWLEVKIEPRFKFTLLASVGETEL